MADLSVDKFAAILEFLDPLPEMTRKLDKRETKKFDSQKAHMIAWFRSQMTTGAKGFTRAQANRSAKKAYNRLLNTGALIWIADALGEQEEALEAAVRQSEQQKDFRERCAVFREAVPWARIDELIRNPKGWRIDPALKGLIIRKDGWPSVKPSRAEEFRKTLLNELGF